MSRTLSVLNSGPLGLVGALLAYLATGAAVMLAANRMADSPLRDDQLRAAGILGWPIVLFVAAAGFFAVWSAQRELDKIGGEPDE